MSNGWDALTVDVQLSLPQLDKKKLVTASQERWQVQLQQLFVVIGSGDTAK